MSVQPEKPSIFLNGCNYVSRLLTAEIEWRKYQYSLSDFLTRQASSCINQYRLLLRSFGGFLVNQHFLFVSDRRYAYHLMCLYNVIHVA